MIATAARLGASAKLGERHQFARVGRSGTDFGLYLETCMKEVQQLKVNFFADAKLSGYAINLLSDVASARDAIAASRQARRQGDAVILNYSPSDLVCDTLFVLQVPATMMKETSLRLQTQTWR